MADTVFIIKVFATDFEGYRPLSGSTRIFGPYNQAEATIVEREIRSQVANREVQIVPLEKFQRSYSKYV